MDFFLFSFELPCLGTVRLQANGSPNSWGSDQCDCLSSTVKSCLGTEAQKLVREVALINYFHLSVWRGGHALFYGSLEGGQALLLGRLRGGQVIFLKLLEKPLTTI